MFRFFTQKKWQLWSWLGSITILLSLWLQVKIDVKINASSFGSPSTLAEWLPMTNNILNARQPSNEALGI